MSDDDKVYRIKIDNVKSDASAKPFAVVDELWLLPSARKAGKSTLAAQALVQQHGGGDD